MVAIVIALITSFALFADTVLSASSNSDSACDGDGGGGENPFQKGCLIVMAEEKNDTNKIARLNLMKRVCNSDDIRRMKDDSCSMKDICRLETDIQKLYQEPNFEVRIEPSNFEESIILGWIYQILLSEVLHIPATIEGNHGGNDTAVFSFYYHRNSTKLIFNENKYIDSIASLVNASEVEDGDCTKVIPNKKCAHIIPSVYAGGKSDAKTYIDSGNIIHGEHWNGIHSRIGYFIPRRTKDRYPSFDFYRGLQNESGQELAKIFKTPKTWEDFCENYSTSTCDASNDIASRLPSTKEEKNSYFVEGLYKGYFHYDACTTNCNGNIIVPDCESTNYAETQLFHNGIYLTSRGQEKPNNGFGHKKINEIYDAANATQEDVFIWGYTPDLTEQKYLGTDYEWHRVTFPRPNSACIAYRKDTNNVNKCSEKVEERRGNESTGFCDYDQELPTKLFSKGIEMASYVHPEAKSPAFDLLKNLVFDPIPEIFSLWNEYQVEYSKNNNGDRNDPYREGVCEWVYNNIDTLLEFVPNGFPENPIVDEYQVLSITCLVLGSIAMFGVIISFVLIYRWRDKRTMRYAQVDALLGTTIGYGFLTMAAITYAMQPSNVSCTLTQWFTRLGYTLAIVPILTKISAINRLTDSALRLQRAEINHSHFRIALVLTISILVTYLTIWTSLDTPCKKTEYEGEKETNNIRISYGCSSESMIWETLAFISEAILLLAATVLTYQSRNVFDELDETRSFAFLVYSHFLFLIMRSSVFLLMQSEMVTKHLSQIMTSSLLSCDTLVAILIYFGPKFLKVMRALDDEPASRFGVHVRQSRSSTHSMVRSIPGIRIPEGGIPNLIRRRQKSNEGSSTMVRQEGNSPYLSIKKSERSQSEDKKVTFSINDSSCQKTSTKSTNTTSNDESNKETNGGRSVLKNDEIQDIENEIMSLTQSKKMTERTSSKLQLILFQYSSYKKDLEANSSSSYKSEEPLSVENVEDNAVNSPSLLKGIIKSGSDDEEDANELTGLKVDDEEDANELTGLKV